MITHTQLFNARLYICILFTRETRRDVDNERELEVSALHAL